MMFKPYNLLDCYAMEIELNMSFTMVFKRLINLCYHTSHCQGTGEKKLGIIVSAYAKIDSPPFFQGRARLRGHVWIGMQLQFDYK